MQNSLTTLQKLSQAISQVRDQQSLFDAVQQAIVESWGSDIGLVIAYYDPGKKLIHLPYIWDKGEQRTGESYPLQDDTISNIVGGQQPILLADAPPEKERFANIRFSSQTALSLIASPLMSHGEILGAIIVQEFSQVGRFPDDDLLLLNNLAALVSAREESTRLLDHIQTQMERDKQLYGAANLIRSTMDMQTILNSAATELGRILGAQRVHIEIEMPELLSSLEDEPEQRAESSTEGGGLAQ